MAQINVLDTNTQAGDIYNEGNTSYVVTYVDRSKQNAPRRPQLWFGLKDRDAKPTTAIVDEESSDLDYLTVFVFLLAPYLLLIDSLSASRTVKVPVPVFSRRVYL